MKKVHAIIFGRVQLVMMRDFVCRKARLLGLVGTVKNLSDGTVEVYAEGTPDAIQSLLSYLHIGSALSSVEKVDVSWYDDSHSFPDFRILYS